MCIQEVHVMLEEPCEKQQTTPPWVCQNSFELHIFYQFLQGLGRTTSRSPLSEDKYSYQSIYYKTKTDEKILLSCYREGPRSRCVRLCNRHVSSILTEHTF